MIVVKIHLEQAEIGEAMISKSKPQDQQGTPVVVIAGNNQIPVVSRLRRIVHGVLEE